MTTRLHCAFWWGMAKERKINVGVIAAAGKGTRAWPRTSWIPKPLFTFENRSLLARNVALQFEKIGVDRLYILIGHLQEQVLEEVNLIRHQYPGKHIETAQWTGKGLAADVASLQPLIQEDFCLILGDEFYHQTNHDILPRMWQKRKAATAMIALLPSPLKSEIRKNYSVVARNNRVAELVEKPENPPNNLLGLGSYVFSPAFFEFYHKTEASRRSGVIELTDVIQNMANHTAVYSQSLTGRYFNINSLADYYAANYMIRAEAFDRFKISMIIPALNNEDSISDMLHDFEPHVDEMLVIDMGSSDRTAELARGKKVRLFQERAPQKFFSVHYAPAIYAAMRQARGDILILCPADGSFRALDLTKILEYLKDADMVIGTRTTRQMMEQGSNLKSGYRWLNVFFGKLVEILWWSQEPRLTDIGCLYRGIWKESFLKMANDLTAKSKVYALEMIIELMRYHMRCIEIPISFYRTYGSEQVEGFVNKWRYFWSIVGLIMRKRLGGH
ncbi:MAG: glycosyltransferase [Leptospiraceae bacterium]|nr:glycosyltransferase [Leptospiraceae bacterium]